MNKIKNNYLALTLPAQRVFWIILIISLILALFSVTLVDTLVNAPNTLYFVANAIPFVLTLISLISAALILSKRVGVGAWLFFASIASISLLVPFIAAGYGFPVAVLALIVTILIPIQIMRGSASTIAMIIGITIAGLIITVDILWPFARVPALAQDVRTAQYATGFLSLLLLLAVIAIYGTLNVGTKLLVLTLGASFISVVAIAWSSSTLSQSALSTKTRDSLLSSARHTADAIDTFVEYNRESLNTEASMPIFREFLLGSPLEQTDLRPAVIELLRRFAARNSQNISSYAVINDKGIDVVDTNEVNLGSDSSGRDFFIKTKLTRRPYVSPVRISSTTGENLFDIGAPIIDTNGQIIGVLRASYRTNLFEDIIEENSQLAGAGSYGILLDEYNITLVNPVNPEFFARPVGDLDTATIALLQSENRLTKDLSFDGISLNMRTFSNGLRNSASTPYFQSEDTVFGEPMQIAVATLQSQPWKVAFVQPVAVANAPTSELTRTITIVALIASFIVGISTLFISRTITVPIAKLTETAGRISSGNLTARAQIQSRDELGTLADTLNAMSAQLEETLTGLESTITERTAELEKQTLTLASRSEELEASNERAQRRAGQLLAIAGVTNAIATIQNLEELLPRITEVIHRQFGFYHVGIFLNDALNKFANLRATNSEGGQRMLARGHRLEVGATGIVGTVAGTGKPRIALDTGSDAVYFSNPDLPNTRSEMALPLFAGNAVIGVLDVQSTERNAFTGEDIEILGILANQVSIAIRNAQLFEETQRTNAEIQLLLQQDVRTQWLKVARAQKSPGLQFDGSQFTPIEINRDANPTGTMTLPIKVRGQAIGKLGIKLPNGSTLTQDEMDIVNAIAERLAISAENARLLEDSQERAAKEQKIGEISAKIGASINLRSIMQTAVEELGHALPGSEVSIHFDTKK
jgi:GAF domain-containing protein/HAMP domain-containing protein